MDTLRKFLRFLDVAAFLFVVVAWAAVVLVPLFGVWVSSAIAAYLNGPVWVVCLAGLLAFPGLPLAWEAWSSHKHAHRTQHVAKDEPPRRWLRLRTRVVLRTFVLNLVFLTVLLFAFPSTAYLAMSTRGDWFLDSFDVTETTRGVALRGARGLEWIYEASSDDDFRSEDPPTPPDVDDVGETRIVDPFAVKASRARDANHSPSELAAPVAAPESRARPVDASRNVRPGRAAPVRKEGGIEIVHLNPEPVRTGVERTRARVSSTTKTAGLSWPLPARMHPLATSVPDAHATDYRAVARYIGVNEPDPFQRVKAMHDWVVAHLAYDWEAYEARNYPSQAPADVFERGTAVCGGYARLLVAMGEATGDEIVYISGQARSNIRGATGVGPHAWNAAKIEDRWYLLDATWNDGDDRGGRSYRTDFLFAPPEAFGWTHFPDDAGWQLQADPINRAEFMRRPAIRPAMLANSLTLISPTRAQVDTANGAVEIRLRNPRARDIRGSIRTLEGKRVERCADERDGGETKLRCELPTRGRFQVLLFVHHERGAHDYLGRIAANWR